MSTCQCSAILHVVGNPGRPKCVAANRCDDSDIPGSAANHLPDIGAVQPVFLELLRATDGRAKQRRFLLVADSSLGQVGVPVLFEQQPGISLVQDRGFTIRIIVPRSN